MIVNCEGDELCYRAAFACQRTGYRLHPFNKMYVSHDYRDEFTKTQLKEIRLQQYGETLDEHYTLEQYAIIEEEHQVKYTIDRMVEALFDIRDASVNTIHDVNLWLSPSDHSNFRYKVANTCGPCGMGYKAGRGAKPHWLLYIRDRLIYEWGAGQAYGYEADDMLGIHQTDDTIASHIDKDINMIPGLHYNHVTKEVYEVSSGLGQLLLTKKKLRGNGLKFFYAQLIMGDRTDNIPGIQGYGDIKTCLILDVFHHEENVFRVVEDLYKQQYGEQYKEILAEVADLVWIVRKEGQTGRMYLQEKGYL